MKAVAVSQRVDAWPERGETRDALDQRLNVWLVAAGYLPYPVPNGLPQTVLAQWLAWLKPGGVILSGGNDIGTINERDSTEAMMLDYAAQYALPLLGLCRGMQMLAQHAAMPLITVDDHVRTRHLLHGEIQGEVNSYHNLGVADCPQGYRVLARSADGGIEAIQHNHLPWDGWMWHPERETPFREADGQWLKSLFG